MKTYQLVVALAAGLFISSLAYTQEAPKPQKPAAAKPEKKPAAPKVSKPWADLKDLSDDQKAKIVEIQKKGAEDTKALQEQMKAIQEKMKAAREQQTKDIVAVLTDAQKAEYQAAIAKEEADKKAKEDARKAEAAAKKAAGNGAAPAPKAQ